MRKCPQRICRDACGFVSAWVVFAVVLGGLTRLHANDVPAAVLKAEADRVAVIEKISQMTLAILAPGGNNGGSGVIISPDGYALTNFHVTSVMNNWMRCGMADGKLYDAVIVGVDPVGDVALIKLIGRDDFPHATLGDSDQVKAGDWAIVAGNPFLLATDFKPTITYGIISGVHRYQYPSGTLLEYADCIQTDASINPGNSGGPLFDAQGNLIGINGRGSFEKRGRVNVGVGYAISINQIKKFLGVLHSGRIVDHATLGAVVASQSDGRVTVSDILEDSDAFRRGLRYGDEIISFAGREIDSANAFKNALGTFPDRFRIPLTYRRQGKSHEIWVRLQGVHSQQELLKKVQRLPGDEPMPNPKGKEPKKEPEQPPPDQPMPPGHPKAEMPAELAKQFELKRGFANYYFNRQNQERVWKAFQAHGSFQDATSPWTLKGIQDNLGDAEFVLSDEAAVCKLPGGTIQLSLPDDLLRAEPLGSGGLMSALSLWRRMLTVGPAQFGETTYLGRLPLPERTELFDCLQATFGGVECEFYFHPTTGILECVEAYAGDTDPCELYFSEYAEVEGRLIAKKLVVKFGNQVYSVFAYTDFAFKPTEQKGSP